MKKLNKKGFTLVELLAVIVLLALVMIVAGGAIGNTLKNSNGGENVYILVIFNKTFGIWVGILRIVKIPLWLLNINDTCSVAFTCRSMKVLPRHELYKLSTE